MAFAIACTQANADRLLGARSLSDTDWGYGIVTAPIRAGTDAGDVAQPLSAAEVRAVLEEAFTIMSRARAQIRQPLDSRTQVSLSVVDTRESQPRSLQLGNHSRSR